MGRRFQAVFSAVCVLSLSLASASQITLTGRELLQNRILSDLKQAQEKAGIFVDDSDLFLNPQANSGRKLLQASELTALLSNPTILTALLGVFSSNSTVGGFPGAALSLPGGSPFGYAPTSDSYCLFSTSNESSAKATVAAPPGALPETFTCVEGSTAAAGGFIVTYDGQSYACVAATPGRKLLQTGAVSPTLSALLSPEAIGSLFDSLLNAVGLPIWNCVTATTPEGNTTVGETTMAVLNDLGVVAEHFLNYLNADGQLSYAQTVQNDFVSLANPLYPDGPRLNISIDFSKVAKDQALFEEIFGFPAPSPPPPSPSPPPPVATVAAALSSPATTSSGGNVPAGSTPTTTSSQGSSSSSSAPSTGGSSTTATTTTTSSGSPPTTSQATTGAPTTPPPAPTVTLSVYDGYVSNCQVVLGSVPGTDGNFQQVSGFQAVILNGQSTMTQNATAQYNASIAYVVPASKAIAYTQLTAATASSAQYCYDIATLEPQYNPIATTVVAGVPAMAGNAITTVAVFGEALGATADEVTSSLGVTIPAPDTLWTYDAIAQSVNGSAAGLAFLNVNSAVQNLVTAGANYLTNDSSVYASYAIIMNQALAQKILYSPASSTSTTGRKMLQTSSSAPAVDLTNATTVASILDIAQTIANTSGDAQTLSSLITTLTPDETNAVATAVANLNALTASAANTSATQASALWADTVLADSVADLGTGALSLDDFQTATSNATISTALAAALPGSLLPIATVAPAPATAPPTVTATATQSSSTTQSKKSSGVSNGGKIALAVIFPVLAVAAALAFTAYYVRRRSSQGESSGSTVWYRRPFARSGAQSAV